MSHRSKRPLASVEIVFRGQQIITLTDFVRDKKLKRDREKIKLKRVLRRIIFNRYCFAIGLLVGITGMFTHTIINDQFNFLIAYSYSAWCLGVLVDKNKNYEMVMLKHLLGKYKNDIWCEV